MKGRGGEGKGREGKRGKGREWKVMKGDNLCSTIKPKTDHLHSVDESVF